FSTIISAIGIGYLMFFVNVLTGLIGVFTLAGYVFVFTPVKKRTTLCTLFGGVSGAAPPLVGWSAGGAGLDAGAVTLFVIFFLWQMPHFFAIAWIFTEDYKRGGFLTHGSGVSTGRQIIFFCCALIPISVLPTTLGLTGMTYLTGAILLGFVYLGYGSAV